MLEQIYWDKVFLEVSGIDPARGLTIEDPAEADVKKRLLKQSKEVIVMAPHSRLGHVAPVRIGEASQIGRLMTHSSAATAGIVDQLQKLGVKVTWV
jgi:DeoR/GlpR family transcriptional regulator of sugar metabolism